MAVAQPKARGKKGKVTAPRRERRRRESPRSPPNRLMTRARRKFLRTFPGGFRDETYVDWERDYKWQAHLRWQRELNETSFRTRIAARQYEQIARLAGSIESRTNLLFSFEKMALRDAVRSTEGAQAFTQGLFDLLHGAEPLQERFEDWIATLDSLPRRQTRVLTWPLATVFGFIAQPKEHFFFKPTVTREAFRRCGIHFDYASRPSWPVYRDLLNSVRSVRRDIASMRPRDMVDLQSFLWVQGSDEYPD
jgi:hypothetical protein